MAKKPMSVLRKQAKLQFYIIKLLKTLFFIIVGIFLRRICETHAAPMRDKKFAARTRVNKHHDCLDWTWLNDNHNLAATSPDPSSWISVC